jgi:adenosylcobinamide-GDP ribazoletransferase
MRGLILAVQFLTRLPTPQLRDFEPNQLASSAIWFPWVGVLIGALVTLMALLGARIDTHLGALSGVLMWVWITGALHLDGLADLTDALGAAHRDPQRLLAVMRDPHLGSFGVIALIAQIISKLVLLFVALTHASLTLATLPLICAWARFGAIVWSAYLPALSGSSTDSFTWQINTAGLVINAVLLSAASIYFAPLLMLAPLVLFFWAMFLKLKVGGMSGDCLGAGVEITETLLLLLSILIQVAAPFGWPQ